MNADAEKLIGLFKKLFDSQGIKGKKVDIEEENLNFAINIKITHYQSLNDIKTILRTFRQIEMITKKDFTFEVELYHPLLTLYMDKKVDNYNKDTNQYRK